jgi:hypothetical protein
MCRARPLADGGGGFNLRENGFPQERDTEA